MFDFNSEIKSPKTCPMMSTFFLICSEPSIQKRLSKVDVRKTLISKKNPVSTTDSKAISESQMSDEERSGSDSDSKDDYTEQKKDFNEVSSEYWPIQKLTKYLRIGNQTATVIAISALKDFDLTLESNQIAIRDVGALEILLNLLETKDPRCIKGSLYLLKIVSKNRNFFLILAAITASFCDMNGIKPLVSLLKNSNNEELKCLASETLSFCAMNSEIITINRRFSDQKTNSTFRRYRAHGTTPQK
jgi:hypothetical protein